MSTPRGTPPSSRRSTIGSDRDTITIRVTDPAVTRITDAGEELSAGDEGADCRPAAEGMIRRGEAVRVDGCQGETADGTPCSRDADDGEYCHQHASEETTDASDED